MNKEKEQAKAKKKPTITYDDGSTQCTWKLDDAMIYEAYEREKKRRGA